MLIWLSVCCWTEDGQIQKMLIRMLMKKLDYGEENCNKSRDYEFEDAEDEIESLVNTRSDLDDKLVEKDEGQDEDMSAREKVIIEKYGDLNFGGKSENYDELLRIETEVRATTRLIIRH
ncbi:unnamed protein product [Blepharisma stoltei]|uniref:Uncharacterized protein n=1 Tax=Blepharisma stoltei TaxID=1481888 RepID=A0AAU9KGE6_9CILI|nr:unnamed protein product [Blepharisma stoltei]